MKLGYGGFMSIFEWTMSVTGILYNLIPTLSPPLAYRGKKRKRSQRSQSSPPRQRRRVTDTMSASSQPRSNLPQGNKGRRSLQNYAPIIWGIQSLYCGNTLYWLDWVSVVWLSNVISKWVSLKVSGHCVVQKREPTIVALYNLAFVMINLILN